MAAALAVLWLVASVGGPRRGLGGSPSARLVAAALTQICPAGGVTRNAKGRPTGCHVCPKQTDVRDLPGPWTLEGALTGRFTSAHERDLLLTGLGCEPHDANTGGAFVFALPARGLPQLLRYDVGLAPANWQVFRLAAGRDFLLGRPVWGATGTIAESVVEVLFGSGGRARAMTLFAAVSDVCPVSAPGTPPGPAVNSRILHWRVIGQDGAVPVGLVATATWGREPYAEVAASCDRPREPRIPVKTYSLRFRFNGRSFLPTRATSCLLRHKFSPARSMWRLMGSGFPGVRQPRVGRCSASGRLASLGSGGRMRVRDVWG